MVKGRVLIVAGSDSGGGAGIQADIKAVTAMGAYAATAITALTAQNTRGVFGVVGVAPDFIRQQMRLVLDDIGADAIKTGMLGDSATIEAVAEVLRELAGAVPIVVDPVMVAQSGDSLLRPEAVATLARLMLPLATLLTPNLPEAETLLGRAIPDAAAMPGAAQALLDRGAKAVLLKGGHLAGRTLTDVLAEPGGTVVFESRRIESSNTHGTGCTLASATAAGLAQGLPLRAAVERARSYVQAAIRGAPGFGQGNGPLDHLAGVTPFQA
jgi:hydroxymethylpyrimidine/phosphomethylpyrimidine kinase